MGAGWAATELVSERASAPSCPHTHLATHPDPNPYSPRADRRWSWPSARSRRSSASRLSWRASGRGGWGGWLVSGVGCSLAGGVRLRARHAPTLPHSHAHAIGRHPPCRLTKARTSAENTTAKHADLVKVHGSVFLVWGRGWRGLLPTLERAFPCRPTPPPGPPTPAPLPHTPMPPSGC